MLLLFFFFFVKENVMSTKSVDHLNLLINRTIDNYCLFLLYIVTLF